MDKVRLRGGRQIPEYKPKADRPAAAEEAPAPMRFAAPKPEQVHSSVPQRHEAPEQEQVSETHDEGNDKTVEKSVEEDYRPPFRRW